MHHHLPHDRPNLHARFSPAQRPVLHIDSGDTVSFSTPDVSWGLEPPTSTTAPRRKVEPRDPITDNGPSLCGPVSIRGALPGDALQIDILHLHTAPWGWTYAGKGLSTPALNAALGIADSPLTLLRWTIDRDANTATNHLGHTVPTRPFLGTVGLAPTDPDACPWTPRATGGNLDCRELVAGTTLYLPIESPGALLSVGDGHAAQGDGELAGTAIECPMEEARLRLTIRRDMKLSSPRIRTDDAWITMGFAPTLDHAAELAASAMLDLLAAQLNIPRPEALALASARVHLRITQMVNPLRAVHAVLPD